MPDFKYVTTTAEIPIGGAKAFVVGEREIAVFNIDGTFHAIDNSCPHQGGPLAEGSLDGNVVSCPWHGWCFDVTTGAMTLGGFTSVDAFDVRIDGTSLAVATEPRV